MILWMTLLRYMSVRRCSTLSGVFCTIVIFQCFSSISLSPSSNSVSLFMQHTQCLIFSLSACLSQLLMNDAVVLEKLYTLASYVELFIRNYSRFIFVLQSYSAVRPSALIQPRLPTRWGSLVFIFSMIRSMVNSVKLLLGFTNSITKGRPPFNILTSMSSRPPAWNLTSMASSGISSGQKNLRIYFCTSSCRLDSVNLCLLIIQGVCDKYLENLTQRPHRQMCQFISSILVLMRSFQYSFLLSFYSSSMEWLQGFSQSSCRLAQGFLTLNSSHSWLVIMKSLLTILEFHLMPQVQSVKSILTFLFLFAFLFGLDCTPAKCMSGPNIPDSISSRYLLLWSTSRLTITVFQSSLMVDVSLKFYSWLIELESTHLNTVLISKAPLRSTCDFITSFTIHCTSYSVRPQVFLSSNGSICRNTRYLMVIRVSTFTLSLNFDLFSQNSVMICLEILTERLSRNGVCRMPVHSQQVKDFEKWAQQSETIWLKTLSIWLRLLEASICYEDRIYSPSCLKNLRSEYILGVIRANTRQTQPRHVRYPASNILNSLACVNILLASDWQELGCGSFMMGGYY